MKKFANYWASSERALLVVVLLLMISLAVLQILLRNVFSTSLYWIDPLNRLLVLWLAVLGAMVASREGEHIAIDVLKHYLSGVWLSVLGRTTSLFAALVCLLMSYHSVRFVYDEMIYKTTTFSELPAWPFELIIPIGFFVMFLRFVTNVIFSPTETEL